MYEDKLRNLPVGLFSRSRVATPLVTKTMSPIVIADRRRLLPVAFVLPVDNIIKYWTSICGGGAVHTLSLDASD